MKKVFILVCLLSAALAVNAGGAFALNARWASRATWARQTARPAPKSDTPSAKPAAATPQKTAGASKVRAVNEIELSTVLKKSAAKHRPLLVNFWATWCEPCRAEFPDLVKIDDKFHARGLDFITVSLDDISDIETGVPEFLRLMRATRMSAYLLNADDQDAAIDAIDPAWRGELPATFLYDRQGKLTFTHKGRIKPAELQAAVEKVLNAK